MTTFWFIVIAILWAGFMVLEGFDFGVGALHGSVGVDDTGRQQVLNTIGPVWDGNEVWLITAAAAMFAAFPGWYATAFSGLYLAMILVLIALILRGVAIVYRGKQDGVRWRRGWSVALIVSSLLLPFLFGIALADFGYGLPIDANQEFVGSFWDLLPFYSVVTGIGFLALTLLHGAVYISIKTDGAPRERAARLARFVAPVAAVLVLVTVVWTRAAVGSGALASIVELATVVAIIAAVWLVMTRRYEWAFLATATTLAGMVLSIFTGMYPNVMVSSLDAANNLTIDNASSGSYSLKVMTVILVVLFPVVLIYQGWAYRVFHRRVSTESGVTPP
jgi:cytochrome bd ubiquinol oxidase subunit II